jgi:4-cresol dehydrogenase (hydroxylating) flavoprotein subunit
VGVILPPPLTAEKFRDLLSELRRVVGAAHVFADPEWELPAYNDAYLTTPAELHQPSAAVAPASVEEIQRVLAVARRFEVPLWTISTGKNFAYGGPAPRKAGHLVLDLKRMSRILEVNEIHGYAVVEPGVSYFDLYQHLQKIGSKLWIDCAAPGWGGVMPNALEHGVGYTPYGDHLLMQCGMEVLLADGTLVNMGMGALPNSRTTHLYKYGFGPWMDGLFTQSNFGIVTKMGIWLMPAPPGYRPYMVTFEREDDLHAITEAVRPLKVNMLIPAVAMTVELIWEAAVQKTRRDYYQGSGPLPGSARKKIQQDLRIGAWNFYGALYGPPPMMDNTWEVIRDSFAAIPGAKFYFDDDRKGDVAWEYRKKLGMGVPNMTEYGLMNWIPNGAHIDFSPISPVTGDDAMKQYVLIRDRCHAAGFDYCGEFAVGWRDMHHIFCLTFDRTDAQQKANAHKLFGELVEAAAVAGYGEYRTHLDFMDQIASTYSWNQHALLRLQEKIKDSVDPGGILSPGKMGIWPRGERSTGNPG